MNKRKILFIVCIGVIINGNGNGFADTLFVDTALSNDCAGKKYCITNRTCGCQSTYKGFKKVQTAIDSMKPGDVIMLRGGTYKEGYIHIPASKNGTSWQPGKYNTIKSFGNEWAILDGENNVSNWKYDPGGKACVIGFYVIGYEPQYWLRYWKFERIEIKNGRSGANDYAAGFFGNKGPFWFSHCYIHDNKSATGANNSGGITGYVWDSCTVEYCTFKNNGSEENSANDGDIVVYSDYAWVAIGGKGLDPSVSHVRKNEYHHNLFQGGSAVGIKYKGDQSLTGRCPDSGHGYSDTYKNWGDIVHHNIFTKLAVWGINPRQDFGQIYNNIFDGCSTAIETGMRSDPTHYKISIYNNTIINSIRYSISQYFSNYLAQYSINQDPHYWSYTYNNLIDGGRSQWDNGIIGVYRQGTYPQANFDNFKASRNYFYRSVPSADDPNATLPLYVGNSRYTTFQYSATFDKTSKNWQNKYNPNNLLFIGVSGNGRYITRGGHVLNGDTTIANGGLGGNHPFLDGMVLPSYIGATDPNAPDSNSWVNDVQNLANLGNRTVNLPPIITQVGFYGNKTIYSTSTKIIRWAISADNPIGRCSLFVSLDSARTWIAQKTITGLADSFSWTVSDTAASQCYIKVTAVDDSGKTGSGISSPFKIIKQLKIQKKKLNSASLGRYYMDSLLVETGVSPFSWTIVTGYLPASLYLDSLTGIISGIAHTKGLFPFTLRLTDAELHTIQDTFSILVDSIIVGQNLRVPFSDTNVANPNSALLDTFSLENEALNLNYSLFANRADKLPVQIDSLVDTIRTVDGKKALVPRIPDSFFNDSVGCRAFFVISNGLISDTVQISHRVRRDTNNCDNIGVGNLEWTPLSVTAFPEKNDLQSVLSCFNTQDGTWKYDKTKFRIIQWYPDLVNDTTINKYVEWTSNFASYFKIRPGKLFWIKSNETKTVDFGKAVTPYLTAAFPDTLNAAQWTDFSIPFNFPILFQDIINTTKKMTTLDKSMVDALEFYQWEKSGKTWIATLFRGPGFSGLDTVRGGAGKAYTVFNPNAKNVLQIPPICAAMSTTPKGTASLTKGQMAKAVNASWHVRFDFHNENGDGLNPIFIGYCPNTALPTYLQPPPSFTEITARVFDRSSKKTFGHAFVHDISSGGIAQEFVIENSTGASDKITGSVRGIVNLPNGYLIRFYNPETGSWAGQQDSFSVSVPANGKQYVFVALGKKDYLDNFKTILAQYKTQLNTAYPNPCTRKLTINYSLSYLIEDIKGINFAIFDLRGRAVWSSVRNDGFHTGSNSVVFYRKNKLGQKVSSGVYIVRMTVTHRNSRDNEVFNMPVSLID
jgi:hypothetical protein